MSQGDWGKVRFLGDYLSHTQQILKWYDFWYENHNFLFYNCIYQY